MARVYQDMAFPGIICGGVSENGGGAALYGQTGTPFYSFALWRSRVFQVGQFFKINSIRFSIYPSVENGVEILPVLRIDNETLTSVGTTINNTNFEDGTSSFILTADNFNNGMKGTSNFYFEFQFTGTSLINVLLPINIEIETETTV